MSTYDSSQPTMKNVMNQTQAFAQKRDSILSNLRPKTNAHMVEKGK